MLLDDTTIDLSCAVATVALARTVAVARAKNPNVSASSLFFYVCV